VTRRVRFAAGIILLAVGLFAAWCSLTVAPWVWRQVEALHAGFTGSPAALVTLFALAFAAFAGLMCVYCGQPGRVGYLHPCVVSRDAVYARSGDPPAGAGGPPT